jgi:hypothetical protein
VNRDGWPGPLAVSLSLLLLAGPGAAAGGTGTNPWHANDIMWYANDIDLHTNDIPLPATDPAAPSGSTDAAIAARLLDAEQALDGGESYAQLWWGGWLGLFSASALGSGAISLVATPSTQPVWRIGALRSALGVASVLAVPFPAAWAPGDLRALPESTPAERKLKLGAALSALHRAAAVERLGRSWLAHAGGLLASGLGSLWIWRGYHQPGAAALALATGLAASEAKIFTMPTRAIDDAARLDRASFDNPVASQYLGHQRFTAEQTTRDQPLRVFLVPTPAGLLLAGTF